MDMNCRCNIETGEIGKDFPYDNDRLLCVCSLGEQLPHAWTTTTLSELLRTKPAVASITAATRNTG